MNGLHGMTAPTNFKLPLFHHDVHTLPSAVHTDTWIGAPVQCSSSRHRIRMASAPPPSLRWHSSTASPAVEAMPSPQRVPYLLRAAKTTVRSKCCVFDVSATAPAAALSQLEWMWCVTRGRQSKLSNTQEPQPQLIQQWTLQEAVQTN